MASSGSGTQNSSWAAFLTHFREVVDLDLLRAIDFLDSELAYTLGSSVGGPRFISHSSLLTCEMGRGMIAF